MENKLEVGFKYSPGEDKFIDFSLSAPLSVCWQLTRRCNLACPYCISDSGISMETGLPAEKNLSIIRKLTEIGVRRVDFSGGEPLLEKDLPILIDAAKAGGMQVVVTTNGTLIDDETAKMLSEKEAFVQVSLDGGKEVNDKVRGKGSFQLATAGIRRLVRHGVPTRINTVISRINKESWQDALRVATDLGVKAAIFIIVSPQGRAEREESAYCLSPEEGSRIKQEVLALHDKYPGVDFRIHDYRDHDRSCLLILPKGDVVSQSYEQKNCTVVGNIFEKSLAELWTSGNFNHLLHVIQYFRYRSAP